MMTKPDLTILLCAPRGFCAGVVRAIDVVEQALKTYGAPVYVRHEIVHNRFVVDDLKRKGAVFVRELDDPKSAAVISAVRHLVDILGLSLVVEGVETMDQLTILSAGGHCDIQGFLFSEPVRPEKFEQFLQKRKQQGQFFH